MLATIHCISTRQDGHAICASVRCLRETLCGDFDGLRVPVRTLPKVLHLPAASVRSGTQTKSCRIAERSGCRQSERNSPDPKRGKLNVGKRCSNKRTIFLTCFPRSRDHGILVAFALSSAIGAAIFTATVVAAEDTQAASPRHLLDADFRQRLVELATRCEQLKLPEQAAITRGWLVERDPHREHFFISQTDSSEPPADARAIVRQWHKKFRELRDEYAAGLFALAAQEANAGNAGEAYRLLYEVLWHAPDHKRARHVLALPTTALANRIRPVAGTRNHPTFGWRRRRYWRVESQHYRITTNHSTEKGLELAKQLEAVHCLWRQLFFRYWSDGEALRDRFNEGNSPLGKRRKLEVVLFRDQEEYVSQLQKYEPQIAMSLGYYMKSEQTAFFYVGDSSVEATWYHEATHQLFQELGDAVADVGELSNFWIVEGVAVYMESLVPHEGYWSVGGIDADRLQYARFRALTGEFFLPLTELVTLGREDLQRHKRIRPIYTQSAGMVHFLMHAGQGEFRQPLIDFITLLYLGRARPASLAALCEETLENLDAGYLRYLQVEDDDLKHLSPPAYRRSLGLGRTAVTDEGMARLAGSVHLHWLDVSFTSVTNAGIAHLGDARELRRLNLEGTKITDQALAVVANLGKLEELDLSNTQIGDAGLAQLSKLKNLKELWLTNTKVTDAGIAHLAALKQLEFLDVERTGVTANGVKLLMGELPKLNQP